MSEAKRRYTPAAGFILFLFGLGWAIGSDTSWYWGLLIAGLGAVYQTYINRGGSSPMTFFVIEEDAEEEKGEEEPGETEEE